MLTPDADRLWNWLREQPSLAGFVLIGGSALSMRIDHRLSADLDLVFPGPRLPTLRLDRLRADASAAGIDLLPDDDEAAVQEFLDGGLELRDYQQDFVAGPELRLSFFAADPALNKSLLQNAAQQPRLAELAELFRAKCLVCAKRSKTRDRFDLYVLIRDHGFTLSDMETAFAEAGVPDQMDIALTRLCSGRAPAHDEGLAYLLPDPPDLETIAVFFRKKRDEFEIQAAARTRANPS